MVRSQPGKIVPISKKLITKRAGEVAQGVGLEFKPQYHTHTKKKKNRIILKTT
jgi:hypothetical protein